MAINKCGESYLILIRAVTTFGHLTDNRYSLKEGALALFEEDWGDEFRAENPTCI